jgi:DNA-binding beta-propeller fold protein YncE
MNSTSLTPITIVVASPNDVLGERNSVTEAAERINTNYLVDQGYILRVFRWEIDSYPGIHPQGPQGIIDDIAKIRNCDVLIGIFWKRLGTPINQSGETGTEHEIYEAYHAWIESGKRRPQIMLYFNNEKVSLKDSKEREQYLKVTQFRERLPSEILGWRYENLEEFKTLIYDHLSRAIKELHLTRSERVHVNTKSTDEYIFFSKWDLSDENEKFSYTEGIDIDSHGYVYVADEGGFVRKFDKIGSLVKKWGGKGVEEGKFETAYALAIDSSDKILVSDSQGRIQKFSDEGSFLNAWGSLGNGDGQFSSPFGLAIDIFGNIFVTEESNHRIQKFDRDGNFITKWGKKGQADGDLQDPIGIDTDSKGNVYVADYMNHRIQVFDSDGKFLRKWGSFGNREGQFDHPHGITLDINDMVYVSDSVNHRIQKFTNYGIFITAWGSEGEQDGELKVPRDLVVDKSGIIYVSDGTNHRVQVFIPKNVSENKIKELIEAENLQKEKTENDQIELYLDKIENSNAESAEVAYRGLEKLARHRIIWNHDRVWNVINKEILQSNPSSLATESLDLLKTMLFTGIEKLGKKNQVSFKAKELYLNKLTEILESVDDKWQHQKLFTKQVVDQITEEDERYGIYWKAWKKCASEITNDSAFTKFTGYFIDDIVNGSLELKKSIQKEMFALMESDNDIVVKRVKGLASLLF